MASEKPIARVRPAALRAGDMVGIVAPASNIKRAPLEQGCEALRRMGYKPFYLESILERDLYFAGASDRRTRELEEMFERDDIRAIVCARGGYGSNYLLPRFDVKKAAAHPKIFVGYSDLTSLMTRLAHDAHLITFHGPMVTKDFVLEGGVDVSSWMAALGGVPEWSIGPESGASALVAGRAEGVLYGGCLSILVASMGTPYEIRTEDTVLFLEDIAAKPFQIDRMLMQLKLGGKLAGVRGIVFGEMLECRQSVEQDYTLQEVILRVVGDLGIPVAFGLRSGHVSRANITLPLGVRARLEVGDTVRLTLLESSTV